MTIRDEFAGDGDPTRMGTRDGQFRADHVSRRLVRPIVLVALVLLFQPRWSSAEDPFRPLELIKPSQPTAAKDFTVSGLDSRPLRLSSFKDKVRLVNFWATWCRPCKEEMPSMERLYRRYQDRGFTIIAISIDANIPAVEPFVKHLGITFPVGLDPKLVVANDYTVRALPGGRAGGRRGDGIHARPRHAIHRADHGQRIVAACRG